MLTSRLTVGLRLHECIQALLGGLSKQTCGAVRLITGLRHYSCAPEVHRFVEVETEHDMHTKFTVLRNSLSLSRTRDLSGLRHH